MTTKEIIKYLKTSKRDLEARVEDMGGQTLSDRFEMKYCLGKIHMLNSLIMMFEIEEHIEGSNEIQKLSKVGRKNERSRKRLRSIDGGN